MKFLRSLSSKYPTLIFMMVLGALLFGCSKKSNIKPETRLDRMGYIKLQTISTEPSPSFEDEKKLVQKKLEDVSKQ